MLVKITWCQNDSKVANVNIVRNENNLGTGDTATKPICEGLGMAGRNE